MMLNLFYFLYEIIYLYNNTNMIKSPVKIINKAPSQAASEEDDPGITTSPRTVIESVKAKRIADDIIILEQAAEVQTASETKGKKQPTSQSTKAKVASVKQSYF